MFAAIQTTVQASLVTITTLAGALNKGAKAIDNVMSVAEEKSAVFADEARHNRVMERKALEAKMAAWMAANPTATPAVVVA